jgi:PAS domain S-box-containing protein
MQMENDKKNQPAVYPVTSSQLWNVLENIADAFIILDPSWNFTYINKKTGRIFRRNYQYLIGKHIWTELPELQGSLLQPAFEKAAATGYYTLVEEYYYSMSHCWLSASIYPSPEGLFVFIKDITRNKQAEKALQKSEEKYRLLIEQAMDGIFICDRNGWFSYVNIRACEMSGYTKDELLQLNFMDLVPVELRENEPDMFYRLQSGPLYYKDGQLLRKDGSIMYVELCSQFTNDGNVVTISHDITAKRKAEMEFRKTTARLRELSDHLQNIRETERTKIAREIHDELGQQLTILKLDISWIQKQLKNYHNDAVVQRTKDTIQLLNETIKTVRRIATELRPSMLDDLGLIAALEWQSREFESRSAIKVTFESNVTLLSVEGSIATSLFRIYQEALTNIARHAKATHVYSDLQVKNDIITLTIQDDGQGFDLGILTGNKTLGILGMQERALMMKGRFEINSVEGKGTTIVVTTSLPVETPD